MQREQVDGGGRGFPQHSQRHGQNQADAPAQPRNQAADKAYRGAENQRHNELQRPIGEKILKHAAG